ncbi:MAG: rhamnulose-1-phosphate aldolase [Bacteroidota bacterium]
MSIPMKEFQNNNKALKKIIHEMAETADYLWQRGWAERNAGNISVNISFCVEVETSAVDTDQSFDLPVSYPELAGAYFMVTGTNKRMRDLARKPEKNTLIIQLNDKANGYRILSKNAGLANRMPTSELPTHLGIHQLIARRGGDEKVVMHTHATELIAITHAEEFCNEAALNKLLLGMHPETVIFVPKGIGFVPYILPGTAEIATGTLKALQNHDVAIWEKHGVFAIGNSMGETFDIIDILAKSAGIFLMCRSAGIHPKGFTSEQLARLKKLGSTF